MDKLRRTFLTNMRELFISLSCLQSSRAHTIEPTQSTPWKPPAKQLVLQIENTWVELRGMRLAARLWLPESSSESRVPVVLEYTPYRKRDTTRDVDDITGQYLAESGIAFARVDVPGSGDSDGILTDEYTSGEQHACVEVIAWLAEQAWCNGAVGMRGYSWGAQSALQAAAQRPPALKAIMPFCASDHRFADDAHWIGGALALANFQWASFFKGVQCSPPDPAIVGAQWRDMWQKRLRSAGDIAATWVSHQCDDSYWQSGDLSADYSKIQCPVYLVGGLVDAYTNSIPRMLSRLTSFRRALIGPWAHGYPQFGSPGPALDWKYEEVRWWYRWLYAQDTGITAEPLFRVYMPEKTASEVYPMPMPGRWLSYNQWPIPHQEQRHFSFANGANNERCATAIVELIPTQTPVGLGYPEWLPFSQDVDLPAEQSRDDESSLSVDLGLINRDMEILGRPLAYLVIESDQPIAHIALRLNAVLPSGQSWNLTYGILNLTHRDGSSSPSAMSSGHLYQVKLELNFCSHLLKSGMRLRAALSSSLWPLVWAPPTRARLKLHMSRCQLVVPTNQVTLQADDINIPMVAPTNATNSGITIRENGPDNAGRVEILKTWPTEIFVAKGGPATDPLSSQGTERSEGWTHSRLVTNPSRSNKDIWNIEFQEIFSRKPNWDCRVSTGVTLESDDTHFIVSESIRAFEGTTLVHESHKKTRVLRQLV